MSGAIVVPNVESVREDFLMGFDAFFAHLSGSSRTAVESFAIRRSRVKTLYLAGRLPKIKLPN